MMGQMGNTVTDPRVFQGKSNAEECTNLYYTFSVCVCVCLCVCLCVSVCVLGTLR